jgi:hypothetical protein
VHEVRAGREGGGGVHIVLQALDDDAGRASLGLLGLLVAGARGAHVAAPTGETMSLTYFDKGDRVAWSHVVATEHGQKSVMRAVAVLAKDGAAQLGTVIGPANDVGTWWEVHLDGTPDDASRVLTKDELVRVEE